LDSGRCGAGAQLACGPRVGAVRAEQRRKIIDSWMILQV
jgi:hypothetical protein